MHKLHAGNAIPPVPGLRLTRSERPQRGGEQRQQSFQACPRKRGRALVPSRQSNLPQGMDVQRNWIHDKVQNVSCRRIRDHGRKTAQIRRRRNADGVQVQIVPMDVDHLMGTNVRRTLLLGVGSGTFALVDPMMDPAMSETCRMRAPA